MHFQPAFRESPAQIALHLLAAMNYGVHSVLEKAMSASSVRFGSVKRHIGLAQQQRGIRTPIMPTA